MKQDTSLYRECNRKLRKASLLHGQLCQSRTSDLALSPAEHRLLMRLAREGGTASQKALAEKMEISSAAVAVALKQLEAEGYVKKQVDASDCRIKSIRITEEGEAIVRRSRAIFDRLDAEIYDGLEKSEIEATLALLEKICENARRALGGTKA
ncbi:MAG: MarR family transcriptional regulator [Clostridia bacterium]|nr:MarR family transcriptional regulator [Clostridia bacterium]MBO7171176.1 MarR family transcriptional regulator [Clostridia bacterium]